jgi:hypothetical protein
MESYPIIHLAISWPDTGNHCSSLRSIQGDQHCVYKLVLTIQESAPLLYSKCSFGLVVQEEGYLASLARLCPSSPQLAGISWALHYHDRTKTTSTYIIISYRRERFKFRRYSNAFSSHHFTLSMLFCISLLGDHRHISERLAAAARISTLVCAHSPNSALAFMWIVPLHLTWILQCAARPCASIIHTWMTTRTCIEEPVAEWIWVEVDVSEHDSLCGAHF